MRAEMPRAAERRYMQSGEMEWANEAFSGRLLISSRATYTLPTHSLSAKKMARDLPSAKPQGKIKDATRHPERDDELGLNLDGVLVVVGRGNSSRRHLV